MNNVEFYLSNRPQVSMGYTTRDVDRTREEFVNHVPHLRILRVFYQHPKWFISL